MSVVADGSGGPKVEAADGHQWNLLARLPGQAPRMHLLWLPALGVAARHYLPFAEALAARGVAVYLHEWRGNGSSSLRPSHAQDWGYRELLQLDLPASIVALPADAAPLRLGGHSLGGQLACCYAGQHPEQVGGLWLVGSGTPFWRSFPAPRRWLLPPLYRFLPWLARRRGALHGARQEEVRGGASGARRARARTVLAPRAGAAGGGSPPRRPQAPCGAPLRSGSPPKYMISRLAPTRHSSLIRASAARRPPRSTSRATRPGTMLFRHRAKATRCLPQPSTSATSTPPAACPSSSGRPRRAATPDRRRSGP